MSVEGERIDLRDLVEQVLRRRWLITAVVVGCAVIAAAVAIFQPTHYEAVVVLTPAPDDASTSGAGTGLSGGISGLVALAGLGPASSGRSVESVAVLRSDALTRKFIEDNRLLPVLYANRWDPVAKSWKVADRKDIPTLWTATRFFHKDISSVQTETTTGLVTLTVRWKNAEVAAQWANGLVALVNQYLRDRAIARSESNIAYLNEQAARTTVVEVREAMFDLMEGELKRVMFARGTDEYAFRIIDPAVTPDRPSNVPPVLLVAAGIVGGLLLGIFMALVQLAWTRSR